MAYVPVTSDPKFTSVQSFRTTEAIYVRVATKENHGWDKISDVYFSNSTVKSNLLQYSSTFKDGFSIHLLEFNADLSKYVTSALCKLSYSSGVTKTATVYFDVSEIPTTFGELIFDDKFEAGSSNNTYGYNCAISSRSLRNSLRTFIYPSASKDSSGLLDPTKDVNQYYISNSATTLYIASSALQNSYFNNKIKHAVSALNQEKYGYFAGGVATQQLNITCSAGNKNDNVNIIKGFVTAFNLKRIASIDKTYSVCTLRNASNYYRTSPYPDCDGNNLSLAIIDNTNYSFIEGGCCNVSRTTDEFSIDTTVKEPTANDTDGGEITWTWRGGASPYDLIMACPDDDATCVAVNIDDTPDLSFTRGTLSGSDRSYTYSFNDKQGNTISGSVALQPAVTAALVGCNTSGAINYDSSVSINGAVPGYCRWCDATTGELLAADDASPPERSLTRSIDLGNFVDLTFSTIAPTITTLSPLATSSNGEIFIEWEWNSIGPFDSGDNVYEFHIENSNLFGQGTGTEKFVVTRRTLTKANFHSSTLDPPINEESYSQWAEGTSETSFDVTDLSALNSSVTSVPLGYYIYKFQYSDSSGGGELTECAVYKKVAVTVTGCTDALASNTLTFTDEQFDLVIPDNESCNYAEFTTLEFNDLCNNEIDVSIQLLSNSSVDCAYSVNFYFQAFNSIPAWGTTAMVAPLQVYTGMASLIYHTFEVIRLSMSDLAGYNVSLNDLTAGDISFTRQGWTADGLGATSYFDETIEGIGIVWDEAINKNIVIGTADTNINTAVGVTYAVLTMDVLYLGDALTTITYIFDTVNFGMPFSYVDLVNQNAPAGLCQDCTNLIGPPTLGCTNIFSCNYNPTANVDDGSCVSTSSAPEGAEINGFYTGGILDITINGTNYPNGNPCGCTDPLYFGYDAVAEFYSISNDNIPFTNYPVIDTCGALMVEGCMDSAWSGYDSLANVHNQSMCGSQEIVGCTDQIACNYDEFATTQESPPNCIYQAEGCEDLGTWELTALTPPISCNSDDTATGAFTIANASYSGPFSIKLTCGSCNWLVSSGSITPLTSTGINPDGAFTITQGNFLTGVATMNVIQTAGTGTTITFTGVHPGIFNIHFAYTDDVSGTADMTAYHNSPCNCSWEGIQGLIGDYIDESQDFQDFGGMQQINILALGGVLRSGAEGPCGCMDPDSGTFDPTATVSAPSNCLYYGCTDPAAPNYLPTASSECLDPINEYHAGQPCSPCVYGFIDSMYTPAFCMPLKIDQQLDIIRKCIGTAGTSSYINTITGKSDCEFKDAWKLILIEYLMSKKGLDCIYNCADSVTPNLGEMESCADRQTGSYTGHIGEALTSLPARRFYIGDVISIRQTAALESSLYVLKSLPSEYAAVGLPIYHEGYEGVGTENYLTYSPYSSTGSRYWKLCEEPPSKPTTEDYIGKFTTFVQNYCRQCQLPVGPERADETIEIESVITVNGIVITVNNSDLK